MRGSAGGPLNDPFFLTPYMLTLMQQLPAGRTQVLPALVGGESTAVILSAGQSLQGVNNVIGAYSVVNTTKNQNYCIATGGLYRATERMLGTGGEDSSFLPRLADKLITAVSYARVINVPFAVGGSTITHWIPGAVYDQLFPCVVNRLALAGLTPTMMLWAQGETDSLAGMSEATYEGHLTSMVNSLRDHGIECPLFIGVSAFHNLATAPAIAAIRDAQEDVIAAFGAGNLVFTGADTDTLGDRDATLVHFTPTGANLQAGLWQTVIETHFGL